MFNPALVAVTRYRYRGNKLPKRSAADAGFGERPAETVRHGSTAPDIDGVA
ncbi:hypothetical protein [Saccharopolyspora spinosa]|uniref:Uncharacterized protein n=1 Tax=Saccharopolyspora spinosa TaxID=60894 RepID=A0A2N3Y5A6_SACSN|nr:hypothetical protein A8926_6173 [Saccharopolyspora spinosa]